MKCRTTILMAAAVAGFAGAASAAPVFQVTDIESAYYAPADAALSTPLPVPAKVLGSYPLAGTYEVDLYIHAANLNPGTSFGSLDFKPSFTNVGTSPALPGWQADTTQVDSNGAAKGGLVPLWDTNAAFGSGTNQDIIAGVAVGSAMTSIDPRLYVGQPASAQSAGGVTAANQIPDPTYFGSFFVTYDGSVQGGSLSFAPAGLAQRNNTSNQYEILSGSGGSLTVPGSINFGAVPEPTSIGLLAVGGLLAARRRRA